MSETPKLRSELYWEWRTTIEEMNHFKTKMFLAKATAEISKKEMDNAVLRYQILLKTKVAEAENAFELAKKEYDTMRERIEKEVGFSLANKMIDDITFEIRDIPSDAKES